jgi:RimJ/RimL family protein N-acetyltransferase
MRPYELNPATPRLKTARLLLTPLREHDAAAFQALFAHWEIVRHLTHHVPWPYPAGEARRFIVEDALPAMGSGEEWHWSLRLRSNPEQLIGAICLMDEEDDNRGFWLGLPWQRQGLMSEACRAVNHFWFATLGRERLRVAKSAECLASRRLSEREGMRKVLERRAVFVSGPATEQVWELSRSTWLTHHAP